jgi:hypothetical protein
MRQRHCGVFVPFLLGFLFAAAPAFAYYKGLTGGKVAIIDTPAKAYGFSAYSGLWTSVQLDSPALSRAAGYYLGYVRTAGNIYCYNTTNDHWYSGGYVGTARGEDVRGGTIVFWTNLTAYGISTVWTLWRPVTFGFNETPKGGGSAGSCALVWTQANAYAYNAGSGQWIAQQLDESPIAGVTNDGMGFLWTHHTVYAFDSAGGNWLPLSLGDLQGISASGSGKVALVWGGQEARAYSGVLNAWYSYHNATALEGGNSKGEVALIWDSARAYAFNANTGNWLSALLQSADVPRPLYQGDPEVAGASEAPGGFSVEPNPAPIGRLSLQLPPEGSWNVQVINVEGEVVRQMNGLSGFNVLWDGLDDSGNRIAPGTYWVRAESEEGTEARRVVLY